MALPKYGSVYLVFTLNPKDPCTQKFWDEFFIKKEISSTYLQNLKPQYLLGLKTNTGYQKIIKIWF
jgi:hypothetical protein